ncbi:hypothetical protein NQZ68_008267 [Dissostichus eleginoides]|nr:hypothetical protein NQZ68_008267 [Dissostichus eleginoides]
MKPDSPESSSRQGPDVNAEKTIWKIHNDLKLRTFLSRVCFASQTDQISMTSGYRTRLASNAICTANGGHFARARRRTKSLPDPWSMGVLRGAILRNVAAKPKMAGLAYESPIPTPTSALRKGLRSHHCGSWCCGRPVLGGRVGTALQTRHEQMPETLDCRADHRGRASR